MHPTERALVEAIRATDSDRLRLILADWLEEHGRERDGFTIRWHLLHKARFLREFYGKPHPPPRNPPPFG